MSDSKYIVIVWGECGLTNEIGFINFWRLCTLAISITHDAYIGWFRSTDTACIVMPVQNGIGKAISKIIDRFDPVDLRIMTKTLVDEEIVEVSKHEE